MGVAGGSVTGKRCCREPDAWGLEPLDFGFDSEVGNQCRVTFKRGYFSCPMENGIENKEENRGLS